LKEQGKGTFGNTIELAQMPLGLVPEVLDAIDMPSLGIDKILFVVDSFVLVSLNKQLSYPLQKSDKIVLRGKTFLRMIGTNSAPPQLAIIWP
jgi:hypothetical protein